MRLLACVEGRTSMTPLATLQLVGNLQEDPTGIDYCPTGLGFRVPS